MASYYMEGPTLVWFQDAEHDFDYFILGLVHVFMMIQWNALANLNKLPSCCSISHNLRSFLIELKGYLNHIS